MGKRWFSCLSKNKSLGSVNADFPASGCARAITGAKRGAMNDNSIRFGDYVAEPRDNGDYYLHHPNGGGAMATLAEVAAIKGIIKEREYSAWLQGECDKAVDALYKCNAEVAALRAQLHTEIEQRQFVGDLITNMPHARLAAEFEEFKAEVAAANLREEPHAQPCPCAWCRLERDNQGEQ